MFAPTAALEIAPEACPLLFLLGGGRPMGADFSWQVPTGTARLNVIVTLEQAGMTAGCAAQTKCAVRFFYDE